MKRLPNIALTTLLGCVPALCSAEGLLQVYQHAKDRNPVLRVAAARKEAEAAKKEYATGALLPHLALNTGYTMADNVTTNSTSTVNKKYYPRTRKAEIQLTQSIIDFEKWREVSLQKGSADIESLGYQMAQQKLILDTVAAYLNILRSVEEVRKFNSKKISVGRALARAKQRFQLGMDPISELYSAQSSYDSNAANLIKSQSDLEHQLDSMALLTGYRYKAIHMLDTEHFDYKPPINVDVVLKESGLRNLELAKCRLAQNVALKRVHSVKAKHLPTINFTASAAITKVNKGSPNNPNKVQDLCGALTLNLPLFTGGQTSSIVKQACLALEEARANLELLHRQTVQKVRTTHNSILTNISMLYAANKALVSAQMSLEATNAGFEVGTKSIIDVLNAIYFLDEAKTNLFNSRYDYLLNSLKLKYETGELCERDLIEIDKKLSKQTALSAILEERKDVTRKRASPKQVGRKSGPVRSKDRII